MANYGELMCEAIDLIVKQRLTQIQYDSTQICTIVDDSDKDKGIYIVSNGSARFEAYGNDTYRKNDSVYVNIPNGDMNEQKFIQGKRTTKNANEPFVYEDPFKTLIDVTGNLLDDNNNQVYGLIANEVNETADETVVTIIDMGNNNFEVPYAGYTRLAIKAKFQTPNFSPFSQIIEDGDTERIESRQIVSGQYGLRLRVKASQGEDIQSQPQDNSAIKDNIYYDFYLNTENMMGNPYNFSAFFEQGIVFNIEDIKQINSIALEFYQKTGTFKDATGMERPIDDKPNLKVANISISLGYDTSEFDAEKVWIYSFDRPTYTKDVAVAENVKEINLRWIHKDDNGKFISVTEDSNFTDYSIYWYKYRLGKASADQYSGVYWQYLAKQEWDAEKNSWVYTDLDDKLANANEYPPSFMKVYLLPDNNIAQEQVKAIVFYKDKHYTSNIYTVTNEHTVVNDATLDAIARSTALTIQCEDQTYGNYLIYQLGNRLIDDKESKVIREFKLYFNLPTNDAATATSPLTEAEWVKWYIPIEDTMIQLDGYDNAELYPIEDGYKIIKFDKTIDENTGAEIIETTLNYRISSYYSQSKSNNTIKCEIFRDDTTYTAIKELTFGIQGTSGTDVTLVLDFDNGVSARTVGSSDAVTVTARLYDYENKEIDITNYTLNWYWIGKENLIGTGQKIELSQPTAMDTNYNVLKAVITDWGDGTPLEAYLPVPTRSSSEYLYISGPSYIQYNSQGYYESSYRDPIVLYKKDSDPLRGQDIIVSVNDENKENTFAPKIEIVKYGDLANENILKPLKMYVKDGVDDFVYNISVGGAVVWSQPVFIYQNRYPSQIINDWDGKLIVDENENYVAAAQMIAGTKEDNKFTGVVLGDCTTKSDDSLSQAIGLYGFSKGEQSFGFRENGTAFIGKAGIGRIEFDGENGIIKSLTRDGDNIRRGMEINLTGNYDNSKGEYTTPPYIKAFDFTLEADGTESTRNGKYFKLTTENFNEDISLDIEDADGNPKMPSGIALQIGEYFKPEGASEYIDNRFMVAWDGSVIANNGTFRGHVEATSGNFEGTITAGANSKIGGWTVTDDAIYSGTTVLANNNTNINNNNYLAGIHAKSGTIGGWTISEYGLTSGTTHLYSSGYGSNKGAAIVADSGRLGSWTITSTGFTGGQQTVWIPGYGVITTQATMELKATDGSITCGSISSYGNLKCNAIATTGATKYFLNNGFAEIELGQFGYFPSENINPETNKYDIPGIGLQYLNSSDKGGLLHITANNIGIKSNNRNCNIIIGDSNIQIYNTSGKSALNLTTGYISVESGGSSGNIIHTGNIKQYCIAVFG